MATTKIISEVLDLNAGRADYSLTATNTVTYVGAGGGNQYVFNGAYGTYGVVNGTYVLSSISSSHPIAIINNGKTSEISYTGAVNEGTGTGPDGNTYTFYSGNVTITVSGNFDTVSYYCLNHGYMGGKDNLIYTNSVGESGLKMPSGTELNRPATDVAAMIRNNTNETSQGSASCEEYYNGTEWKVITNTEKGAEWIITDDIGNLFYTTDETGLTGWTSAGVTLETGHMQPGVFNGSIWVVPTGNHIYATDNSSGTTGWGSVLNMGDTARNVMWTGTGWVVNGDGNNYYYTTDTTAQTGWTLYSGSTSVTTGGRIANDGTNMFAVNRDGTNDNTYTTSNFFSAVTNQAGLFDVNLFGRGAFYDNANSLYFKFGKKSTVYYDSDINPSGSTGFIPSATAADGYDFMDYNGTYYALGGNNQINGFVYSTSSTSGYSVKDISTGLNWDRNNGQIWNGTSWGCGGRYTSGDYVMAFINNSDPSGTWTGVSKPTGFNGTRATHIIPRKRPYYNTLTNLGA